MDEQGRKTVEWVESRKGNKEEGAHLFLWICLIFTHRPVYKEKYFLAFFLNMTTRFLIFPLKGHRHIQILFKFAFISRLQNMFVQELSLQLF